MLAELIMNRPAMCVLAALLVVAVIVELRTGRIPNWLTFSGLGAGILVTNFNQMWSVHLWGVVLGFVIPFLFYTQGAAGAGFVKLMTPIGLILGPVVTIITPPIIIVILIYSYIRGRIGNEPGRANTTLRGVHGVPGSIIALIGVLMTILGPILSGQVH